MCNFDSHRILLLLPPPCRKTRNQIDIESSTTFARIYWVNWISMITEFCSTRNRYVPPYLLSRSDRNRFLHEAEYQIKNRNSSSGSPTLNLGSQPHSYQNQNRLPKRFSSDCLASTLNDSVGAWWYHSGVIVVPRWCHTGGNMVASVWYQIR